MRDQLTLLSKDIFFWREQAQPCMGLVVFVILPHLALGYKLCLQNVPLGNSHQFRKDQDSAYESLDGRWGQRG